jgi:hypothetical protein
MLLSDVPQGQNVNETDVVRRSIRSARRNYFLNPTESQSGKAELPQDRYEALLETAIDSNRASNASIGAMVNPRFFRSSRPKHNTMRCRRVERSRLPIALKRRRASTAIASSTAKQVTVPYSYYVDMNLDGQVDVTDLGALAASWQTSAPWTTATSIITAFDPI